MNNFSKFGFILATLGSSIGLGHIWRFPYMAGENGGGAFVVLFLVMSLTIGVAMLMGEMLIGNKTRKNVFDAFKELDPNPKGYWKYAGLTLIGGPIVMTFYSIVLGWVVYYLFVVSMDLPSDTHSASLVFGQLVGQNLPAQIICFSVIMGLNGLIISFGVKDGIERLNVVLMPLLFIIFVGLLIYASFQPSFMQAVDFLLGFRYEDLSFSVVVSSMGQMCFSLSLGVGSIIAYSAQANPKQNLLESALWVVIPGIVISLVAGLMIFTFVFKYGVGVTEGAGLAFNALPIVFGQMGMSGVIVSVLFFVGLAFAGITSSVSLLEPSVMFFTQKYNQNRVKITWLLSGVIYIIGLLLIFSLHMDYQKSLGAFGKSLFELVDASSSAIIMPFGAFIGVIFVGWIIGRDRIQNMVKDFLSAKSFAVWFFVIRYIAPLVVIIAWIGVGLEHFGFLQVLQDKLLDFLKVLWKLLG